MIIKNKGYASFLVVIYGYKYSISNNDIQIDIDLETHDKLNFEYKHSIHNKLMKMNSKLLNILNSSSS